MKITNSEQMREIDRQTINRFGVPSITLMENAGSKVAEIMMEEFDFSNPVIVCGRGGNGGDGFVCARHLAMNGIQSKVFLLANIEDLKGDPEINFGILTKGFSGMVELHVGTDPKAMGELCAEVQKSDIIVDALIGTGLSKAPKGAIAQAIELINAVSSPVLSVDMPSGVDGSTGHVPGIAVFADLTVTFGLPKIGQLLNPGAKNVGKLMLVNVGFPEVLLEDPQLPGNILSDDDVLSIIPSRFDSSHKGNFGNVLIVGGSVSYPGAPVLSGLGSLRTGAGITRLVVPKSIYPSIACRYPEMIVNPVSETDDGTFSTSSLDKVLELADKSTVTVVGPGLSRFDDLRNFVAELMTKVQGTLIIDADALYALASAPQGLHLRAEHGWKTIITPHWGEASRFGSTAFDITKDPISTAVRFSRRFGTITVLKSARTVISSPSGGYHINITGNSSLSKGGSGDVLTGIIAGLVAQGNSAYEASVLGSYLLGKAAEMASDEVSKHGVLGSEVADMVPNVIKEITG